MRQSMTTISVTRETRNPPVRWETFPCNNVYVIDLCLSNIRVLVQTSQDLQPPVNGKYLTVSRALTLTSARGSPRFSWRVWAIMLWWWGRVYHTVPLQTPSHINVSHINFRNLSENYEPFKIFVTGKPSSSGKTSEFHRGDSQIETGWDTDYHKKCSADNHQWGSFRNFPLSFRATARINASD